MSQVPKKIFIVPYRDRIQHKFIFLQAHAIHLRKRR